MESHGFTVECPEFECINWVQDGARLSVRDRFFTVFPSPYTLGAEVSGPLTTARTLAELEAIRASGSILLLRGEIAKEQLMPKNFPFFNPDNHRRIISLLERQAPLAILAATSQDPGMAGAVSPFPMIEDGDFHIPSAYMTVGEGRELAQYGGEMASLRIIARRNPTTGYNVIARKGDFSASRVVLCAHIDCKEGTPGAIDNATGVTILLLVAELLENYTGQSGIEIAALNGEDYYAASGELLYLKENEGRFGDIRLGINLDGVGYYRGKTAVSLYNCPSEIEAVVRRLVAEFSGLVEGPAWYQSDHSLFIMQGRPALAFTTDQVEEVWTRVAHTPFDTAEIVDGGKLLETALVLQRLLESLDRRI
jgi:aminopeptidase YwaD